MKRALVAALAAFVAIEAVLLVWATRSGSWERAAATFREPLVLVMLTDFCFVSGIVFFWMVADARKRGHGASGWLWLPGIILAPTVALILFLLKRERGRG